MAPFDGGDNSRIAYDAMASTQARADPVLRCLTDARARIDKAWGRPGEWTPGAVCIVMSVQDDDVEVVQSANRYLSRALRADRAATRLKRDALYTLNDDPTTAKAQVLALYDKAIERRRRALRKPDFFL